MGGFEVNEQEDSINEIDTAADALIKELEIEEIRRKRWLFSANLVAGLAATLGGAAVMLSFFSTNGPDLRRTTNSELVEVEEMAIRRTNALNQRLKVIEEALKSVGAEKISDASISVRIDDNQERLQAVESLLDIEPRQVIEISRLRDDIADAKNEIFGRQEQVLRELDRAYNLMLALVGALFVSVIAMVAANFLRKEKGQ